MRLLKYKEITEKQYIEYITDWEESKEKIIPGSTARKGRSFKDMKQLWKLHDSDEIRQQNLVPGTMFFLEGNDGRLMGAISFRHELTEELSLYGGNVGYGVRPSERRKGYSTAMLGKTLCIIRSLGYDNIIVTCDTKNTGSLKTILNNGGLLKNKYDRNGMEISIYSIKL